MTVESGKGKSGSEPARNRLARGKVIDAALAMADADGLDAVTIRRLAATLGVTPMAIYWHVRNKDELLDGIAARMLADVHIPDSAPGGWQEELRALLGEILGVLRAHPTAAPLISLRTISTEQGLEVTETLLDILRRGGFSPVDATRVARQAISTLVNLVTGEPGTVAESETSAQHEARAQARDILESLPANRYPRMVEAAQPLVEPANPESYFAFGLDLLLAGIEAMAGRRTAS